MAKKGNVRRISDKKKNKPKVRFSIWMLITIFALTFASCFVIYMIAANIDDNFFNNQFSTVIEDSNIDNSKGTEPAESTEDTSEGQDVPEQIAIQNPVPASAAMDISYLENCCLVTDSTLLGMNSYGFSDILGSESLSAASVGTEKISSSYGTVTVYETLKIKKPMNVYIMLGSDIGVSSVDDMISSYMTLVSSLKNSMPDMKIYIMQLPPAYGDTEKNALINEYNTRLLELANTLQVYCIDTNTEMKDNEGNLNAEYIDSETQTVNEEYYKQISGYILTHTV